MLFDLQPTHDAPAVKAHVVVAHFLRVVVRFGHEFGRAHHLAGVEMVAHKGLKATLRAQRGALGVCVGVTLIGVARQ